MIYFKHLRKKEQDMIESKNGIIGLAIADAMGVPIKFCLRRIDE